jgi:glycosyltransferase involved in cell wall biosynthesis
MLRRGSWLLDQPLDGVQTVVSEMSRSPFEIARMARWVRDNNIDVIHTHMTRAHAFGVLLKWFTGVPVVATAHSCSFQLHWPWNDYVIANSNATRDFHRRVNRVRDDRIETVYCYSDLERFYDVPRHFATGIRRRYHVSSDHFLTVIAGEVTERKGHHVLFKALPQIVNAVPGFRLWILGNANRGSRYVRNLRSIQLDNQLFGRVRWMGLRSNVQHYFDAADLSVVPSLEEPLGLVALESLATKTPVVASRIGGLPEIVHDGISGRLVQPEDSAELADAIIGLANDRAKCASFGEAGCRFVREQFDPQLLTDQVEGILQRVALNV